ncbi:MAG: redoxin family protein [Planctomycetaceae bacterium]
MTAVKFSFLRGLCASVRWMLLLFAALCCAVLCCAALCCVAQPLQADDAVGLSIGKVSPELRFRDIRGLNRQLQDFGEAKAVVLTFTSTTCPLVRRSFPKLVELYREYRDRGVVFAAVNVGAQDTIRAMASQAIELDVPFYFVRDVDGSVVRALGVSRTPEVVILDAQRVLRYRGRIDDQLRPGGTRPTASRADLRLALDEVLAGRPVTISETPVDGCLITAPASVRVPADAAAIPTWSGGIGQLIHARCTRCHRAGDAAPFPLLTYDDTVAQRQMIAEVVETESMPPWYAAPQHGEFQNTDSLTPAQKTQLLTWIAADCPPGDPAAAPEPPAESVREWRIGTPDVVITMLEEHDVPATGFVPYRYTLLPYVFFGETWVEAFEIRPLNRAVVHHCNMAYVTKDGAGEQTFITGYVPGGQPMDMGRFDNGSAFRIPGGAGLGLQIHYTTTGKAERSRIQVGLRFPKSPVRRQLRHFLLDPRGWRIPPYEPAFAVQGKHILDRDITLMGMFTHMHVRGRDMTFYATPPNGSRETLLQIPNFNFEWQLGYEIAAGKKLLPAGTEMTAIAHFDNSVFNPWNPDPADEVRYGPQTIHEMFNGYVFFVDQHEELSINTDPRTGRVKAASGD